MIKYAITKEQCEKYIQGVCEGCGGELSAIETVDNANNPTHWIGCNHCQCFRSGISKEYYEVARQLVEAGDILPYSTLKRVDNENTPEHLEYYLTTQTAALAFNVLRIHRMLKEKGLT